jgi:serine/threonine protein kinase
LIDSHEVTGRKLINQYEVIEELGRGMHGKVKLARNRITGDSVAIKIIPRFSKTRRLGKVMVSPQDKTKKEIAILKKIRHDNVVALLEVIDDPELKKIYMVLEHVELGEIIWRKKGLPSICQYERKRVEREMSGGFMTAEEERYYTMLDNRAALHEVRRARQQSQMSHGDYMWSLEHGGSAAGDSSPSNRSRIPSRDDLAHLESAIMSSHSGSAGPSRDTSRAPSRTQSIRSMAAGAAGTAAGADDDCQIPPHSHQYVEGGPRSFRSQHGSALFEQQQHPLGPLGPLGFHDADAAAAFRGRTPSMAESLFSHMSSIDLNPHHEDPFADDYSYVPCFTIEQARSTFRDTVLGLEYLHYQGVVHRDIKPANLLWTRDHHVKISDFGVSYFGRPIREGEPAETVSESEAQDFDDDLELAKTVGTPAFFAPELCYTDPDAAAAGKEAPKVSEQIDVWSLGVTLYCLVFARIPFLAEDEYQMFRKIAEQDVYIPRRRLRPVDPQTTPTSTSLYKSQPAAGQYRDDSQRAYEDVDPHLHDVLSQMLVKDPEQRIKLRDIKRHPWVLSGIPDAARWLEETDPARPSSGRRIQVDEREMTDAVVPLKFLERARSTLKKTVDKLMSPLTDRAESRSRRRAASSTTSSVAGGAANDPAHLLAAAASSSSSPSPSHHYPPPPPRSASGRDVRRRPSLRGEEPLSSSSVSTCATEQPRLTSTSVPPSPGEEVTEDEGEDAAAGYDPLATVLVSGVLQQHQQQLQQLQQKQHHHPYHASQGQRLGPPPLHTRSDSMAVETGSAADHLSPAGAQAPGFGFGHSFGQAYGGSSSGYGSVSGLNHTFNSLNSLHSLSPVYAAPTTSIGPVRRANYPRPLNYVFPMYSRSPRLEPQTVPTTPLHDDAPHDPLHVPMPVTLDRGAALSADRDTARSRSVDRAMFSAANKHAEATVGMAQVTAHGSSMRARRPRQMRSVDLSRGGGGGGIIGGSVASSSTAASAAASPTRYSPRAEYRLPYPGSDSDVRRARPPNTEARSMSLQRAFNSEETRVTLPFVNSGSSVGSFSPFEESYLRQHMERSPSHLRLQPTIREGCVSPASVPCPASPPPPPSYRRHQHRHSQPSPRDDAAATVAKSSRSISSGDLGATTPATPMTSPSAASSPVGPQHQQPPQHHQQQFQSDPSLPALLSGASSVSTDLEGELLQRPGIVGRTAALLETTDSLTPPALQKEPMTEFPLESYDDEDTHTPRPGLLPLGILGRGDAAAADDDDDARRPTSSPVALTPAEVRMLADAADDADDDSDSDEGFVMRSKRTRRPTDVGGARPAAVARSPVPPVYRRRNTNASTGSNETAKKVAVVVDGEPKRGEA